ncbi:hypothetical protein [Streptomyces cupreus]|uniref:Uncharacterized protein n=1 Tax=Streptomyces cupreus TaxID=2759956 RepID=A0A7X1J2U6_9ACTN|nr:hypothetical protein [Streptomyces cupreus]MBC2903198.1 hypothetical protein [Streptomyces cupreus]
MSRGPLAERNARLVAQVERLIGERDRALGQLAAETSARRRFARELSDLKDEVALHIVAAEHPSSALSDARSMALSLREACEARGIDLRLELARLEGSEL